MPEGFPLAGILSFISYSAILIFVIVGCKRLKYVRTATLPSVTVVVAARNEATRLTRCLEALLAQEYPARLLHVVVVDDRSTDDTPGILEAHRRSHGNLEVITRTPNRTTASPKKEALSEAISRARGEVIFTTDADCVPPPQWLSESAPLFAEDTGMVIGPAPFENQPTVLNRVLALENLATTLVSAGSIGWNIGTTCTGRNLAYRKIAFQDAGGFNGIEHSLSGDDDLLLQRVAKRTRWRVAYSMNPKTEVPSPAAADFSEFVRQRRRHVSAAKYYSTPVQVGYFLFNVSNLCLFLFWFWSLVQREYLVLATALLGLKFCLDFAALNTVARRLSRQKALIWLPVWEFFSLINQTFISPLGFVGTLKWK